jgi:hypothetical protein
MIWSTNINRYYTVNVVLKFMWYVMVSTCIIVATIILCDTLRLACMFFMRARARKIAKSG